MSDIKGNAADAVDKYGDKIGDIVDKAGDFLDSKTGGKHSAQIDQGAEKLKDALDGLDGKNDDIRPDKTKHRAPGPEAPENSSPEPAPVPDPAPVPPVEPSTPPEPTPPTEPAQPGDPSSPSEPPQPQEPTLPGSSDELPGRFGQGPTQ